MNCKKYILLFLLGLFIQASYATRYPEVIFSHSVMPGNYGFSQVAYSGFSWMENVKGRVPLVDTLAFTPGRSISMKYSSSLNGHWEMSLFYPENNSYYLQKADEVLSFWLYFMDGFDSHSMPELRVLQENGHCTQPRPMSSFIKSQQAGEWIPVRIPLSELPELDRLLGVTGIAFSQGKASGVEVVNQLLIDQVEFAPATAPGIELNYPAVLMQAQASEFHVNLTWQLPLDPGIRYAKIYRSEDKTNYEAVGISPVFTTTYTDVVPATDRSYYYKIVWMDYQYRESPFSKVFEAKMKPISDVELLDALQQAGVHFFTSRAEVNSGMHSVSLFDTTATVDVGKSGYSLLAQTVGTARGVISTRLYNRRLANMLDFLSKAENYHGLFPAKLNGRTGLGVHESDTIQYADLQATTSLFQGLLVAGNFLKSQLSKAENGNNEGVEKLIEGIDTLWSRVEWSWFTQDDETILFDHWSPQVGFRDAVPLGGFNQSFMSYLLALASPSYPISPLAYEKGLGVERVLKVEQTDITSNSLFAVDLYGFSTDSTALQGLKFREQAFRTDTLVYGQFLEVGNLDRSLLDVYQIFMAFDPRAKKDRFTNYEKSIIKLTETYRRRDNEMDAGNASPDVWGTAQGIDQGSNFPVIVPAIAAASYAFSPDLAQRSIRKLYNNYGSTLFSAYGFRPWINLNEHKVAESDRALNQAATLVMIENGRTGLIWNLFMQHQDIARMVSQYFVSDKD